MTKTEYLSVLEKKLESFNRELQKEIMEDYEQHFAEGLAEGKSEEKIIEELGNIEDMIRELPDEEIRQEIVTVEPGEEDPEAERSEIYEGEYREIVIDGLVANVTLGRSEDKNIHVDYRNDGDRMRYHFFRYEQDSVLHVGVKEEQGCEEEDSNPEGKSRSRSVRIMLFGRTILSYRKYNSVDGDITLSVRIPEGMGEVLLRTASGDVRVSQVNVGKLEITTASGDVEIDRTAAEQADIGSASGELGIDQLKVSQAGIHSASGDVEIKKLAAGQVNVKSTSGDVSIAGGMVTELELETGSGDVELHSLQAQKIYLQTGSGDIDGTAVSGGELYAGAGSGDICILGSMAEYTIETGSGDVELKAGRETTSVRVETGSGDANVDMTNAENVEVSAETGSGEGVVYGADGSRYQVTCGSCTVGRGDCKVSVSTGSGDLKVKC